MATANEELHDAVVRHQIGLMRVSAGTRDKVLKLLDATEADVAAQIRQQASRAGFGDRKQIDRLEKMLASIREIRASAWDEAGQVWANDIIEIAKKEPEFLAAAIQAASPAVLEIVLPSTSELTRIARTTPFEGRTLKEWLKNAQVADLGQVERAIKIGIVQGESTPSIVRRVVGTRQLRGTDGVTQLARNHVRTITRTAVNAVANQSKAAFYAANADLIKKEQFVATLDSRTTAVCRGNDGKVFARGKGPIPPLHMNCRSIRVPVLDGQYVGERPARNYTQRELVRRYQRENGLAVTGNRDDLPRGTKGAYDAFERKQMRALTGPVSADTTYNEFLQRQTRDVQNDILGETKARLWRDGGLKLDRFVDRDGGELTLSQLAQREAETFRKAGLNPDAYR